MSAYVDFFVRHGNDFIPLGDFSRNSIVYQTMKDCTNVPWEKIIPLTLDNLHAAQTHAHKHSIDARGYIKILKDRIEEVKGFNNSVEEKLEQIETYRDEIAEWHQESEEARYAENYFYFLADLIEAAHDDIDANKYIYAGIEIGRPTIEDIYGVPTPKGFIKSKCQKCGKEMLTPATVFDPEAVKICPNCGAKMEMQE